MSKQARHAVDLSRLVVGEEWLIDGRRYSRCIDCQRVVRMDKPIVGSLHFCETARAH